MQTALRKIGNSTGVVLPRAILGEIGLGVGAALDLKVEDGKLIGTPVSAPRVGWAEAAAALAADDDAEARAWRGFGAAEDDALTW